MHDHISISEAKNNLPGIIHDVEAGKSIQLTRYGKPVAVVISLQEYTKITNNSFGFWQSLSNFRETYLHNIEISDNDFENLRDLEPGRNVKIT